MFSRVRHVLLVQFGGWLMVGFCCLTAISAACAIWQGLIGAPAAGFAVGGCWAIASNGPGYDARGHRELATRVLMLVGGVALMLIAVTFQAMVLLVS